MGAPDGRPGWADYFLAQGYLVYLVDQPARGLSAWHSKTNGALTIITLPDEENRFTAPEVGGLWPQAKPHTQWPSDSPMKGRRGDPVFDAFAATQVESLASAAETETLVRDASAAHRGVIPCALRSLHREIPDAGGREEHFCASWRRWNSR
jgi:hypothetical protein